MHNDRVNVMWRQLCIMTYTWEAQGHCTTEWMSYDDSCVWWHTLEGHKDIVRQSECHMTTVVYDDIHLRGTRTLYVMRWCCTTTLLLLQDKGWPRLTGCLKSQVIFRKRAANSRALLRKLTLEDKASYDSTPPCYIHFRIWFLRTFLSYGVLRLVGSLKL